MKEAVAELALLEQALRILSLYLHPVNLQVSAWPTVTLTPHRCVCVCLCPLQLFRLKCSLLSTALVARDTPKAREYCKQVVEQYRNCYPPNHPMLGGLLGDVRL